jgi:hypothetical protein
MNRAVHAHIRSVMPADPRPDEPVFLGGGARPKARFQELCELAGIEPRANVGTGRPELWELKDLRKTRATYYDAHVPESSVEILGHSVGGITYRHYAHRTPMAFRAITTLPQPAAFAALARGFDGSARAAGGDSPTPRKGGRGDRRAQQPGCEHGSAYGSDDAYHTWRSPASTAGEIRFTSGLVGHAPPYPAGKQVS